MIRYRTETAFGEGYRDATEVMAYEVFELGNIDILETLANGVLKENKISEKLQKMKVNVECGMDDFSDDEKISFMQDVLREIKKETGYNIQYALWLADKEAVLDEDEGYGQYIESEEDIDAYEVGPVVLSDIGYDGSLYGYEELPEKIVEKELQKDDEYTK